MSQDHPRLTRVPDWLVERLLRNDLPPAEATRLRERLAAEPGGPERLATLAASDREILAALPPASVAREVERRLAHRAGASPSALSARPSAERGSSPSGPLSPLAGRGLGRGVRFTLPTFALGAVALVAVFAIAHRAPPTSDGAAAPGSADSTGAREITGVKGEARPQLIVYRKHDDSADPLPNGATVSARDTLQLSYLSAGRRYGVIVSIDAHGTVTPHLPEASGPAAELAPKGETALPSGFGLDGPGSERFLFVTVDVPFSTTLVADALRPGGEPLPKDFQTAELTLRKETR